MKLATLELGVRYPGMLERALNGVSLDVEPGTLCSVLGPNGSGKSTLMRAMLGTVPAEGGEVRIGDRSLDTWDRSSLARQVAAVAQRESIAFPLTVRELVGMGRYPHLGAWGVEGDADRHAIEEALDACDVAHLAGRDVGTLSGGEFQRARIARALAQEPGALVLDEPTASLDIRHQMGILELLRAAADRGLSVLLITHDLELASRFSDRLFLLAGGVLEAEGSPEEVLTSDTLSRVYEWPIEVDQSNGDGVRVEPARQSQRAPADAASSRSTR
ncbi:MAG: ABC transporter ATP-binding protein [Gemmatimonadota bacterium]